MNVFIHFCVISLALAGVSATTKHHDAKCNGTLVHGKLHRHVILGKGINRPYQLSFENHTNTVFFSYNMGNHTEDKFEIGYIQHDLTVPRVVNVTNGFATALHHHKGIVYYGGSDGIYEQHVLKGMNTSLEIVLHGYNIWDMFYKHQLYFIKYPSQRIYLLTSSNKAERYTKIHEKVFHFVIDGENDIFITTKCGAFLIKNGTDERILLEGPKTFRAVEVNNKGHAYFSGKNDIYVVNKSNYTLHKVAELENIFGLTFDEDDNIIYSNPHQIVLLKPGCE